MENKFLAKAAACKSTKKLNHLQVLVWESLSRHDSTIFYYMYILYATFSAWFFEERFCVPLTDQVSLSVCLYFVRYWAIYLLFCIHLYGFAFDFFHNHKHCQSFNGPFANTISNKSAVRLTKCCLDFFKALWSWILPTQTSQTGTCTWFYFIVNLQATACNFSKNNLFSS